ncbi:MAG: class II aldolase/adducin family protein [Oscillospiraceae bacterium]|jgi:L-fuculose-phosphate aldolase|nr:class II aldolase/adducin family protein [Oscillospiraceae bacterium]
MELQEAKLAVIAAGKRLLETGLIARTWGNVSCRVNETQFVITPSGRAYENLTPDEIVLVNIADLSYDGDVKPSSEKGIHAQAYALRGNVNFVIHTHQHNASIISVMQTEIDEVAGWYTDVIGEKIPLATYGLPGTKKLRGGVVAALKNNPGSNAILMAHHGALCVGASAEDAFKVADALEHVCSNFLTRKLLSATGEFMETINGIHAVIAAKRQTEHPRVEAPQVQSFTSFRSGDAFCMEREPHGGALLDVSLPTGQILNGDFDEPDTLEIHRAIYKKDNSVNAIVHSQQSDIVRASAGGAKKLLPYLDDFAQIAGINLRFARFNPNNRLESAKYVVKQLKGRSAVMLEDNGALCVGSSLDEARAVETVVEKNCATSLSADLFAKVKSIGTIDATIMRLVYKFKYSKKK